LSKEEESFWENWRRWYQGKRDFLTLNIGKVLGFETRSLHIAWDRDILATTRDVLDAANLIMQYLEDANKTFQNIFDRLNKLEKKTGTFDSKLKEYIPTLSYLKQFLEEKQREKEKQPKEEEQPKKEAEAMYG